MLNPVGLVALLILAQAAPKAAPSSAGLSRERDAIRDRESQALKALATKLGGDSQERIKALLDPPPADDGSSRFVPLAEIIARPEPIAPPELKAIRAEAAMAYFELASKALKAKPPRLSLADECLRAVVARDSAHAEAFRLLGYIPYQGGWATPFAAGKRDAGYVLHPTFGWVEKDWVPHLDKGELPGPVLPNRPIRWLPVDQADALRREFARGWQIKTEHFAIFTNVPLAEAISFGRHLEALYDLFSSLMADVIGPEQLPLAQLEKTGKSAVLPKTTHRVFYFAEKQEYVDFLLPTQGQGVHDSLGTYLPLKDAKRLSLPAGTSFFYRDPGGQLDVTETLYHEVSHQLLFESAGADKYDPHNGHFWVFEGLGTYFETLRPQPDGSLRIGGLVGKRIEAAQDRVQNFIPSGRLVQFNKFVFNGGTGGDVFLNYQEAMALTVFLMQAQECKYREQFLEYAREVYKGRLRGTAKGLDDRLGKDFADLDREFLSYIKPRKQPAEAGGR
jgi:hypothetical protein